MTAIPLIAGIAPNIISLITGLVHKKAPAVEAVLGPATGPLKFTEVLTAVMTALNASLQAGQITDVPHEDLVKVIIQAVVTSMKLAGILDGPTTIPAGTVPGLISYVLHPGQNLTVSVAP